MAAGSSWRAMQQKCHLARRVSGEAKVAPVLSEKDYPMEHY
jgi:hypothetical protein